MCYKRPVCEKYLANTLHGNFDACQNCEYVRQLMHTQKVSKILLGCSALCFLLVTYLLF